MTLADQARQLAQQELTKAQSSLAKRTRTSWLRLTPSSRQRSRRWLIAQPPTNRPPRRRCPTCNSSQERAIGLGGSAGLGPVDRYLDQPGHRPGVTEPLRQAADSKQKAAQAQVDELNAQISAAEAAQAVPAPTNSPEVAAAQQAVAAAETKVAASNTRLSLAQKALDALNS